MSGHVAVSRASRHVLYIVHAYRFTRVESMYSRLSKGLVRAPVPSLRVTCALKRSRASPCSPQTPGAQMFCVVCGLLLRRWERSEAPRCRLRQMQNNAATMSSRPTTPPATAPTMRPVSSDARRSLCTCREASEYSASILSKGRASIVVAGVVAGK